MGNPAVSLEEVFQKTVELIPPAWQYPEVTCAKITVEDRIYKTTNFKETIWKQASDIFLKGNRIGNIEVYYLEEKPEENEGVFLKEERNLITGISELIGKSIERKLAEKETDKIKWLLTKSEQQEPQIKEKREYKPLYGDLTEINTSRLLLDSVGKDILTDISSDYLDMLDTSSAIYEKNGDYALGVFSSGWCKYLDQASFKLCGSNDVRYALESGKWLCHESCWTKASKVAIEKEQPIDIECNGGIRLFAVPIWYGERIVGAINFGYGNPPQDPHKLEEISKKYRVSKDELLKYAELYKTRPPFITDLAKHRLDISAKLIGAIVESKQMQKEIREARDFLENLFMTSADGILVTNAAGVITRVNRALEEMLGYSSDELIGKYAEEFAPSNLEDYEHGIKYVTKLFEEGATIGEEFNWLKKDGSTINVELNAALLKDKDGNMLGSLANARDINERKEIQKKLIQAEKLKSLGEMSGGVAHDFNNVLAAILGRAQLLKMIFEPPQGEQEIRKSLIELNEGLDVIEQASIDGAETVRRIQEFARRRDDDKHFTAVDLNEIIDNALEFTRTRWKNDAESKGIKINIQKEFATLPTTSGSASELREVVTNLINNSLDAMPQGGEIKLKTYKEDSHIAIKIEDTGVGIPVHIRDKIFDPFFTTKGVQSTGLGMSVSYGIISRHKGTISVNSIEGEGTTFTIKLPISEKVTEEKKAKHFEGKPKKARIMVIEDEEEVRNLLSAILKKGGHEVEVVSDGNQGIEMFEKNEFDLVFTDLGMPGMSGWQVAEKIKSINGRVPVILITGWDIKQEASENKDSWVDLIIHKPFEMEQVLNIVQEGMMLRDRFKAV